MESYGGEQTFFLIVFPVLAPFEDMLRRAVEAERFGIEALADGKTIAEIAQKHVRPTGRGIGVDHGSHRTRRTKYGHRCLRAGPVGAGTRWRAQPPRRSRPRSLGGRRFAAGNGRGLTRLEPWVGAVGVPGVVIARPRAHSERAQTLKPPASSPFFADSTPCTRVSIRLALGPVRAC